MGNEQSSVPGASAAAAPDTRRPVPRAKPGASGVDLSGRGGVPVRGGASTAGAGASGGGRVLPEPRIRKNSNAYSGGPAYSMVNRPVYGGPQTKAPAKPPDPLALNGRETSFGLDVYDSNYNLPAELQASGLFTPTTGASARATASTSSPSREANSRNTLHGDSAQPPHDSLPALAKSTRVDGSATAGPNVTAVAPSSPDSPLLRNARRPRYTAGTGGRVGFTVPTLSSAQTASRREAESAPALGPLHESSVTAEPVVKSDSSGDYNPYSCFARPVLSPAETHSSTLEKQRPPALATTEQHEALLLAPEASPYSVFRRPPPPLPEGGDGHAAPPSISPQLPAAPTAHELSPSASTDMKTSYDVAVRGEDEPQTPQPAGHAATANSSSSPTRREGGNGSYDFFGAGWGSFGTRMDDATAGSTLVPASPAFQRRLESAVAAHPPPEYQSLPPISASKDSSDSTHSFSVRSSGKNNGFASVGSPSGRRQRRPSRPQATTTTTASTPSVAASGNISMFAMAVGAGGESGRTLIDAQRHNVNMDEAPSPAGSPRGANGGSNADDSDDAGAASSSDVLASRLKRLNNLAPSKWEYVRQFGQRLAAARRSRVHESRTQLRERRGSGADDELAVVEQEEQEQEQEDALLQEGGLAVFSALPATRRAYRAGSHGDLLARGSSVGSYSRGEAEASAEASDDIVSDGNGNVMLPPTMSLLWDDNMSASGDDYDRCPSESFSDGSPRQKDMNSSLLGFGSRVAGARTAEYNERNSTAVSRRRDEDDNNNNDDDDDDDDDDMNARSAVQQGPSGDWTADAPPTMFRPRPSLEESDSDKGSTDAPSASSGAALPHPPAYPRQNPWAVARMRAAGTAASGSGSPNFVNGRPAGARYGRPDIASAPAAAYGPPAPPTRASGTSSDASRNGCARSYSGPGSPPMPASRSQKNSALRQKMPGSNMLWPQPNVWGPPLLSPARRQDTSHAFEFSLHEVQWVRSPKWEALKATDRR